MAYHPDDLINVERRDRVREALSARSTGRDPIPVIPKRKFTRTRRAVEAPAPVDPLAEFRAEVKASMERLRTDLMRTVVMMGSLILAVVVLGFSGLAFLEVIFP